ncbi:hypothetical protein [Sphingomonas sp. OTU376]|uniref:hypothetical protein n=1 Tax=Sphingomonas sp. OTU376 TaxID=3043863 RepID=UPI00313AE293
MIYVAFALLLVFTGFFVGETMVSLRRGAVHNRGQRYGRRERPILFWSGIFAWVLNASVGALFFVMLALSEPR